MTSSNRLLSRILETPQLTTQIQRLAPPVLARLIDRVGLEDAQELVALSSTEQLAHLFDEDLWRADRPGEDPRFDEERFLVWLAVMRDAGDEFVAQKLVELPEDLVTLALHKELLVLYSDAVASAIEAEGRDDFRTEKALSDCLTEELDDYILVARRHEGWDDVLAVVLALDRDHHDFLERVLARCARMSAQIVEEEGLYEVLSSEATLEADVAGERQDRRDEAGYVAPSDAAAFLKLARMPAGTPITEHDPLTRTYFRGLAPAPAPIETGARPDEPRVGQADELIAVLVDAGVIEVSAAPRQLGQAVSTTVEPLLSRAMARLVDVDVEAFTARSDDLAYLANVLAAGASMDGRKLRPVEAVRAAMAICNLGLELAAGDRGAFDLEGAVAVLRTHPADGLFRLAFGRIAADVVAPATTLLESLSPTDPALLEALSRLSDECPTIAPTIANAPSTDAPAPHFIGTVRELSAVIRWLDQIAGVTPR